MIAYVNAEYVPDEEATISIFDRGLMYGDAVFDTTRTFGGKVFKLEEHLDRLRRSLKYVELDGDRIVDEVREAVNEVVARSEPEIRAAGDVWVTPIVTRGRMGTLDFDVQPDPTVIVMLRKINFAGFAPLYEKGGVDVSVSLTTRHFAGPIDPRVKATNRLAAVRGELKGRRMAEADGGLASRAWTVIFGDDGSIVEAHGANLCILTEGRIVRPPRCEALEGISLDTTCELAEKLGLRVEERRLTLYDLINADETLITSTSFSVLPVIGIDGIALSAPREVYAGLLKLWIELVGFDFVAQAREMAAAQRRGARVAV